MTCQSPPKSRIHISTQQTLHLCPRSRLKSLLLDSAIDFVLKLPALPPPTLHTEQPFGDPHCTQNSPFESQAKSETCMTLSQENLSQSNLPPSCLIPCLMLHFQNHWVSVSLCQSPCSLHLEALASAMGFRFTRFFGHYFPL